MTDSQCPEPNSLFPTDLDRNRLLDLKPDENVMSETGVWQVFCYKNCLMLIFIYLKYCANKNLKYFYEFGNVKELIDFLEKN